MSRYFGSFRRRADTPTGDYVIEQRDGADWTVVTRKQKLRAAYFAAAWASNHGAAARIMDGETERARYLDGRRVDLTDHRRRPCHDCGLKFAQHTDGRCRTCHNARIGADPSAKMADIRQRMLERKCVLCGLNPPMAGTDGRQCAPCVEQRKRDYAARIGPAPTRIAAFERQPKFVELVIPGEGRRIAEVVWDGTF